MDEPTRKTRYEIFQFWLEHCRPPTIEDLTHKTQLSSSETADCLRKLGDLHHIQLYRDQTPSLTPIAMAHPFSHLPTAYVVCQGDKTWWANCAWCALGLAAMLSPQTSTVNVLLRSSGTSYSFKFSDGELQQTTDKYFITFSPPPSKWWDDVRYACSTIQVCESKEVAEAWFANHGFPRGDVLDVGTVWKLSKAWYGDKHSYQYERKTPDEAEALFEQLGMTSPYWTT